MAPRNLPVLIYAQSPGQGGNIPIKYPFLEHTIVSLLLSYKLWPPIRELFTFCFLTYSIDSAPCKVCIVGQLKTFKSLWNFNVVLNLCTKDTSGSMLDESVSSSWIWKKNEVIKPYNNYVKKRSNTCSFNWKNRRVKSSEMK